MQYNLGTSVKNKYNLIHKAFTLAEVLITLGIIGVIAAITIPTLINNYQKQALFNQFKKAYANLNQVWKLTSVELGYSAKCYYWGSGKNPYPGAVCKGYNQNGDCTGYYLRGDDTQAPLPSDYNGHFEDCTAVSKAILKNLKIVKQCNNKAYEGGCIPDYPGNDTIAQENNTGDEPLSQYETNKATSGTSGFRKQNILEKSQAFVLADGSILISYGTTFKPSIFAYDINGMQGPNKWGYDLFDFRTTLANDYTSGIITGGTIKQKQGTSAAEMIKKIIQNKKP